MGKAEYRARAGGGGGSCVWEMGRRVAQAAGVGGRAKQASHMVGKPRDGGVPLTLFMSSLEYLRKL